jgi:hypothetical protein
MKHDPLGHWIKLISIPTPVQWTHILLFMLSLTMETEPASETSHVLNQHLKENVQEYVLLQNSRLIVMILLVS